MQISFVKAYFISSSTRSNLILNPAIKVIATKSVAECSSSPLPRPLDPGYWDKWVRWRDLTECCRRVRALWRVQRAVRPLCHCIPVEEGDRVKGKERENKVCLWSMNEWLVDSPLKPSSSSPNPFSFFSSKTAFSVLSLSSPIVDFHVSLFSPSSHYKDDFKLFLFHCLLTIFIVILYSLSLPIGINFTYVPFVSFFYLYSLSRTFFFFH